MRSSRRPSSSPPPQSITLHPFYSLVPTTTGRVSGRLAKPPSKSTTATAATHPQANHNSTVAQPNRCPTTPQHQHSHQPPQIQPPRFRAAPVGRQHTRAESGTGSRLPTGAAVRLPSIGEARGHSPSRRPRPSAFRNPQRLSTHQPSKSITASAATQPQRLKAGGPKPARHGRPLPVKRRMRLLMRQSAKMYAVALDETCGSPSMVRVTVTSTSSPAIKA